MRDHLLRASATPRPELDISCMSSPAMSSPTSTAVTSPVMAKKKLLLYRREQGAFVWKNKPGLRVTEDNHMIENIENETQIGELLNILSDNMHSEQSLQNYEFVCSWQSVRLPRYHCVLVSQIEGSASISASIQLPSPVSNDEEPSAGPEATGSATQLENTTSGPNGVRPPPPPPPQRRLGNQNANDNTSRNDTRLGFTLHDPPAYPTNRPRRLRYFDYDAWRRAATEYANEREAARETEPVSPMWA
ncbi:uncharacterized protein N7483_011198 [Penicillium malachiteum]|uniref:uncharacterized protein n=1 Tax=Penicillium malachiteum TaxID=1324776 RepID=UPI002548202C|nr:uncharacterized protein N7483_011198 [Penicillium malachiteum]KAJ5714017.1 hypothetical protein N7483_011198 [Penicillium malachiteum]